MQTKVLELILKTEQSQKNVEKLDNQVKQLNTDVQKTNTESKNIEGSLDGVAAVGDRFTGGLISGFRGALKSIKAVNLGFKSMKFAIISTGIGALIVALGSLTAAFASSEEGQNKFNKLTTVMGAAIGNLVDLLADLGEKLIEAFEKPQQAVRDFGNLIKDNITTRLEGMLELIPQLAKAVNLLFKGEFAEAGKVAVNANAKVFLGVENITEKVEEATEATKEFIVEQKEEMKLAAQVADMRAKADKIERKLLVDRSKLESDIALLRLKARQEDEFSAEERKQALLEAQRLEDKLLNQEKEALVLRRDAQILENTFSRTNKENLDKEAEARAAVNRLVARRADIARTLQRELNTINNQIEAAQKANDEKEVARLKELAATKQKLLDEEIKREDAQFNLLQEIRNTAQEQEIFKLMQQYDKKFELAQGNAELEKALEEKQSQDINAIKLKFEKELTDALNEETKKRDELQQRNKQFALDNASQVLNTMSDLAQQTQDRFNRMNNDILNNEKLTDAQKRKMLAANNKRAKKAFDRQKAAQIAGALMTTYSSANSAYQSQFMPVPDPSSPIRGAIAAGAAIFAGLANVNKIRQQRFEATTLGGSSSGGGAGGGVGSGSQPPQFNIVGNSGVNQIANAVGSQGPVQAFVVAGAVTTQQQLNNAIVSRATL